MPHDPPAATAAANTIIIAKITKTLHDLAERVLPEITREFDDRFSRQQQRIDELETGYKDSLRHHNDKNALALNGLLTLLDRNADRLNDAHKAIQQGITETRTLLQNDFAHHMKIHPQPPTQPDTQEHPDAA